MVVVLHIVDGLVFHHMRDVLHMASPHVRKQLACHDATSADVVHRNSPLQELLVAVAGVRMDVHAVVQELHIGKDLDQRHMESTLQARHHIRKALLEGSSRSYAYMAVVTSPQHKDLLVVQGMADHKPGTVPREDPRLIREGQVRAVDERAWLVVGGMFVPLFDAALKRLSVERYMRLESGVDFA